MRKNIKMSLITHSNNSSESSSDDDKNGTSGTSSAGYAYTGTGAGDECETCHATFRTKSLYDRHRLYCGTLAGMRGTTSSSTAGIARKKYTVVSIEDDALLPTPKEMFMLIQELTLKYNKVKDELDVMKEWAKRVGRSSSSSQSITTIGGAATTSVPDYTPFTSITRQKRQNMEIILNEEEFAIALEVDPILRPTFTQWYSSLLLNESHLEYVFQSDLVLGITSILLKTLADHATTPAHHPQNPNASVRIPFKFSDVKQGSFYIYDTPFSLNVPDLPIQQAADCKWRFIEPCEFQQMVNTIHKLLFKEFKKWQDRNWELQAQMTKQRQQAASSFQNVMSSYQCSPAMASCDGMYVPANPTVLSMDDPVTPPPSYLNDTVLSEDFAALYNKYADKMMGGALSNETIITRVRAKLWKDMKAWML